MCELGDRSRARLLSESSVEREVTGGDGAELPARVCGCSQGTAAVRAGGAAVAVRVRARARVRVGGGLSCERNGCRPIT